MKLGSFESKWTKSPTMRLKDLPPHSVVVEPVRQDSAHVGFDLDEFEVPGHVEDAHAQIGWVYAVSDWLEEHIDPGDLAIFIPWTQHHIPWDPKKPRVKWKDDYYRLHEDDIICILEEW